MTRKDLELAIENVVSFGDTDIFPYPMETHVFHDLRDRTVELLEQIHASFDTYLTTSPPTHLNALSPVGHTGFRWSTQLDPIWNLYVLAAVIALGRDIEAARLPVDRQIVFSYRFDPDSTTQDRSLDLGSETTFFVAVAMGKAGIHCRVVLARRRR